MTREKSAFEGAAARYEAWYETPHGRRADLLEKAALGRLLAERFPHVRSVLEVGCGTGHFTRWLSAERLAAVGMDISAAMLAQARLLDGVLLVQGDASHLPFPDQSFDLVAFITTLEFLPSPQQAVAEALRVGRQGLLFGVLNRWSLLGVGRRLAGLLGPTVYDAAHFFGVGELRRFLRSVACENARIAWHTTLFPCSPWCAASRLPWGGFIALAFQRDHREEDHERDRKAADAAAALD